MYCCNQPSHSPQAAFIRSSSEAAHNHNPWASLLLRTINEKGTIEKGRLRTTFFISCECASRELREELETYSILVLFSKLAAQKLAAYLKYFASVALSSSPLIFSATIFPLGSIR